MHIIKNDEESMCAYQDQSLGYLDQKSRLYSWNFLLNIQLYHHLAA